MNQKALGRRIKTARERVGMTQEELAEAVGCTPQHISVIERGLKAPKLDTFITIAKTLHVSADELLRDDLQNTPEADSTAFLASLPGDVRQRLLRAVQIFLE